jgi:chromosome segregation ATPase
MPWISRRKLERLITMHTAVIDERLRETEQTLANDMAHTQELDRRLRRAESETSNTAERARDHSGRIDALTTTITAMSQSIQAEQDRRWMQVDEQLAAHSRRATEDRIQLEEIIEEVRRNSNQRTARLEHIVGSVTTRLDAGSDDTAGRVNLLANEMARLSIDLRSELAQALAKAMRAIEASGHPIDGDVVDLTDRPSIDWR